MKTLSACLLLVVVATFAALAGCATVNGAFIYHVSGRNVDGDTGEPLVGRRVAASRDSLDLSTRDDWSGWTRTDASGGYTADLVTAQAWSYTVVLGFLTLGSRVAPVPPPLDTFWLTGEGKDGTQNSYLVATPPGGQERTAPGERWVELGELSVGGTISE